MLGSKLKVRRKELGLSVDQLAKIANLHNNTIIHAEQTGVMTVETVKKLAPALQLTVNDIIE